MEQNMLIGDKIKVLRQKRKLKQLDLANALRLTPQAVSKWEKGESIPDVALLVKLAKFFNVTTDYLLGADEARQGIFEATVFYSSLRGFAKDSMRMDSMKIADRTNVLFHHLTECVLEYGGIPVKYVGDGFLCFFSGASHEKRALEAALQAKETLDNDSLIIALNSGNIYLGSIGHPDYSSRDIYGEDVNLVFLISGWISENTRSGLGMTAKTAEKLEKNAIIGKPKKIVITPTRSEVMVSEVHAARKRQPGG